MRLRLGPKYPLMSEITCVPSNLLWSFKGVRGKLEKGVLNVQGISSSRCVEFDNDVLGEK
jgi:hypothetical protein